MINEELNQKIDIAYQLIEERIEQQKWIYENQNIHIRRVSFEDVSLDDILTSILLPLIPELIEKYPTLELKYKWKSYKIYIKCLRRQ